MLSTKSALLVSILLVLLSFSSADQPTPDLVIEIFRHGARGALSKAADIDKLWGNNLGELTSGGMRMHYLVGSALKKQYPKHLEKYDPVNIYVRSTDMNRTIMSAYSQLSGVFEGMGPNLDSVLEYALPAYQHSSIQEKSQTLSPSFALPNNLQAVPIHVVPKTSDMTLRPFDTCNKSKEWSESNAADAVTKGVFDNDMKEVVEYLKTKNIVITNMTQLGALGDTCITNKFQGMKLPGDIPVDSQYYKDMKFAAEYMTVKNNEGTAQQRALYSTPLLTEIKNFIEGYKSNPASSPKFVFLSAHDTTLMTLLAAFNITTPECLLENYKSEKANPSKPLPYPNCHFPQYASNIIFEYSSGESDPKSTVTFYYNGQSVPFCKKEDNQCDYSEFKSYVNSVTNKTTMDNFKKICGIPRDASEASKKNGSGLSTLETILIPICSVLFMSLLGTCILFKKRQYAARAKRDSTESFLTSI